MGSRPFQIIINKLIPIKENHNKSYTGKYGYTLLLQSPPGPLLRMTWVEMLW